MYRDTTAVTLIRAIAPWVLAAGLLLFPLVVRSIVAGQPTTAAWVCLAIIAVGVSGIYGARWRLRYLDTFNRPFLVSVDGVSIMPDRARFRKQAILVKRICLALLMIVGSVFIVLVSSVNCRADQGGFCGSFPKPGDDVLTFFQLSGVTLGLVYIALAVLVRTHENETERLDAIIAHGQHERRNGGPLAGSTGQGWE